jgi:hypothetical protein
MTTIAIAASLLIVVASAQALAAPPIYRCGPDGREYSQTPCPAGREIDAADPRSAQQQRDGQAVAARDARLAKDLAAQRRSREREAAANGIGLAAIKRPAPAAAATHPQGEKKPKKKSGKKNTEKPAGAEWRATSPQRPLRP